MYDTSPPHVNCLIIITCVPHRCHCGAQVDSFGRHAFVCKKAAGRSIRHHAVNELVTRAVSAAAIPNTNKPQGLCRFDGKRPDWLTLVPWQRGRSLVWDVTVVWPLADSYVASAAREARSVAELAATEKEDKYSGLAADYLFQPIAVETLGPINESASDFSHFWPRKSVITPATSERQLFCSSAFPW